jgi:hypothetical protein
LRYVRAAIQQSLFVADNQKQDWIRNVEIGGDAAYKLLLLTFTSALTSLTVLNEHEGSYRQDTFFTEYLSETLCRSALAARESDIVQILPFLSDVRLSQPSLDPTQRESQEIAMRGIASLASLPSLKLFSLGDSWRFEYDLDPQNALEIVFRSSNISHLDLGNVEMTEFEEYGLLSNIQALKSLSIRRPSKKFLQWLSKYHSSSLESLQLGCYANKSDIAIRQLHDFLLQAGREQDRNQSVTG